MDTIRTLCVSADRAVKKENNTYDYNIVGGISVAEGSRVYVDNIAMANNVCEEVSEADKWVYLKTFEQIDVPDVRDLSLDFQWDGGPARNLLRTSAVCKQPSLHATLETTT